MIVEDDGGGPAVSRRRTIRGLILYPKMRVSFWALCMYTTVPVSLSTPNSIYWVFSPMILTDLTADGRQVQIFSQKLFSKIIILFPDYPIVHTRKIARNAPRTEGVLLYLGWEEDGEVTERHDAGEMLT